MEKYTLENGINAIIQRNNNTPRSAIVIYAKINKDEKICGLYYLMTQLLYQGTTSRTAEQLADILDENAIDLTVEKKADYIRLKVQCLNEDVNKALEILEDIINNTTFESYQKEIIKIKGEFNADLDSAKIQAQDDYYNTIFENHSYGTCRKNIINEIDRITKDDLINAWNEIKFNSFKNIAVIGDINPEEVIKLLNEHLKNLHINETKDTRKLAAAIKEVKTKITEKEDANQAQIFQGWRFPDIYSKDYPVIILLNTILGSSGLSSRLFLELREKQGLAYTVRSIFEPFMLSGHFFVYIATEPKNIKTSLDGFAVEIKKIMTEMISDEELENAKNNAVGKRQFYLETNLLEAVLKGYYEFLGLGYDYEDKLITQIKAVTKEDILETAKKYFSTPEVICVLAPKKYLRESGLYNQM